MNTDNDQQLNPSRLRQPKIKKLIIEQIKRTPIILLVCERIKIARSTLYRWRDEDDEFRKNLEEAIAEGEAFINDLSESQLISLIKDKNYSAISFWLRHRHPKFQDRLEISASVQMAPEQLTPEQESIVRQALQLAELTPEPLPEAKEIINTKPENNDTDKKPNSNS